MRNVLVNKEKCQHDEYCSLSKSACEETDFKKHCLMRETDLKDLKLMKSVKERIDRDNRRQS